MTFQHNSPSRQRRTRAAFTLIELLLAISIIVVVIALLLPPVTRSREAGRRSQCKNNLKQIGLALHTYHDKYGAFPPAYTVDADGRPLHSWRTLILPFMDRKDLAARIDLTKPWDDPANVLPPEVRMPGYVCPSSVEAIKTQYLAVVAPQSCLRPARSLNYAQITNNKSQTVMVIEVDAAHAVPWMAPSDADESLIQSLAASTTLGHVGIVHALYADGSIQAVPVNEIMTELKNRIPAGSAPATNASPTNVTLRSEVRGQ